MADRITFPETLNTSVQVGDVLYYSNIIAGSLGSPFLSGTITNIGDNWVEVDNAPLTTGSGDFITNGSFDGALGPEEVSNGSFDGIADGTDIVTLPGWNAYNTVTARIIQNNQLVLTTTTANTGVRLDVTTLIGQTYHVTADTSGDTGAGGIHITPTTIGGVDQSTVGGVDFYFTATSTNTTIYWRAGNNAAGTINIDNVSIKEVTPPTEWTGTNATFVNDEALIQVPSDGAHSYIAQPISCVPGETYIITFNAKGSAANNIRVQDNYSDMGGLKASNTNTALTTSWEEYTFTWEANNIVISRHDASQISWDFYIDNVSIVDASTAEELFFMFKKMNTSSTNADSVTVNSYAKSGAKGSYASVRMHAPANGSKVKLFALGAEVAESSK